MARLVVQGSGETSSTARTSPLHCRYNGFLIGQALSLAFVEGGSAAYAERRVYLEECLRDFDIAIALPDAAGADGRTHAGLLSALLPRLAQHARELAEFALLGGLLTQYAAALGTDADAAADLRREIERLRAAYDLPAIDPLPMAAPADGAGHLVAPGLAFLAETVARLPHEPDTAVIVMPFVAPYTDFHAGFHRPALEHCSCRAVRAWGGAAGEASTDLLLAIIGKAGLFWADVSELDHEAVFAIGAAQALGKASMIVVREDHAAGVPPRIGRDAIVRYDPRAPDWPHGPVLLMAACLAGLSLAAERGDRLRLAPGSIEGAFDEVSQALGRILLPPDARDAQRRGRRALDAGDLLVAEASFDEACRLGLQDDETRLWRGWARLGLGRFADAAADLDAVIGPDPQAGPVGEWRPIAAYLRAMLREAQGDLRGALRDIELAVTLGLSDTEVRHKRDALAARVARRPV